MFIDQVLIYTRSGGGGDGVIHFRREKFIPFGGPDGGDGGKGGDVYFQVKPTLNTLSHFRHQRKFLAQNGSRGGGNNKTGKSGEDLFIDVPAGTMVFNADTDELIGDLVDKDQTLLVCKGGRGGRGSQT
jgi:GTP-binding protein